MWGRVVVAVVGNLQLFLAILVMGFPMLLLGSGRFLR